MEMGGMNPYPRRNTSPTRVPRLASYGCGAQLSPASPNADTITNSGLQDPTFTYMPPPNGCPGLPGTETIHHLYLQKTLLPVAIALHASVVRKTGDRELEKNGCFDVFLGYSLSCPVSGLQDEQILAAGLLLDYDGQQQLVTRFEMTIGTAVDSEREIINLAQNTSSEREEPGVHLMTPNGSVERVPLYDCRDKNEENNGAWYFAVLVKAYAVLCGPNGVDEVLITVAKSRRVIIIRRDFSITLPERVGNCPSTVSSLDSSANETERKGLKKGETEILKNRKRMKIWREKNRERRISPEFPANCAVNDNAMRCRVKERAHKLFGMHSSPQKVPYIEEFATRMSKRRKIASSSTGGMDAPNNVVSEGNVSVELVQHGGGHEVAPHAVAADHTDIFYDSDWNPNVASEAQAQRLLRVTEADSHSQVFSTVSKSSSLHAGVLSCNSTQRGRVPVTHKEGRHAAAKTPTKPTNQRETERDDRNASWGPTQLHLSGTETGAPPFENVGLVIRPASPTAKPTDAAKSSKLVKSRHSELQKPTFAYIPPQNENPTLLGTETIHQLYLDQRMSHPVTIVLYANVVQETGGWKLEKNICFDVSVDYSLSCPVQGLEAEPISATGLILDYNGQKRLVTRFKMTIGAVVHVPKRNLVVWLRTSSGTAEKEVKIATSELIQSYNHVQFIVPSVKYSRLYFALRVKAYAVLHDPSGVEVPIAVAESTHVLIVRQDFSRTLPGRVANCPCTLSYPDSQMN